MTEAAEADQPLPPQAQSAVDSLLAELEAS